MAAPFNSLSAVDLGFEANQQAADIRGNAVMLRELMANLLDNAIRYTPMQGKITVTVSKDEGRAILTIEDSGPGIPLVEREHIFERFYRPQESTGDGCGLGLAIVREIALIHHTEIHIENGSGGEGTLITMIIQENR